MADDASNVGSAAQWVSAGGLTLFAYAIWTEFRAQRAILTEMRDSLVSLLERDRYRAETPGHGVPIINRRARTKAESQDE